MAINQDTKINISRTTDNYIMVFPGWIDPKTCKKTCAELKKVDWKLHTFYNNVDDKYQSYEKELSVFFDSVSTKKFLMERTYEAIYKYIETLQMPWFNTWKGFTEIRFNRYLPGTQMALHCDHIHSMFDGNLKGIPTLSIVGNLNDNYTGAEFEMFGEVIPLGLGDLMIFPSNFMYPHKVKEGIKGTRYSFVSWVY